MSLKLKDFFQVTDGDSRQPFNVTMKQVKELLGIKASGKAGMKDEDVKKAIDAGADKAVKSSDPFA